MPKLFRNTAVSGSHEAWSREFKDYALMVDPALEELFMIGESPDKKINGMFVDHKSSIDLDKSFHYFITSRLEGEAKMLALNAIVGRAGKEHKSGAELWRLLMYNFDKKTVYNIVNVVEISKTLKRPRRLVTFKPKFQHYNDCTLSIQKVSWKAMRRTSCLQEGIWGRWTLWGTLTCSRNPISYGSCLTR